MRSSRRLSALATASAIVALVFSTGVSTASASHFRASGPDFTIVGNTATWVVTTAWESNSGDYFVGLGGSTEVREISSYSDAPGSGTGTGVELEVVSETSQEKPLYAETVETFVGDLSTLDDGLYEVYVDNCCRVDDIQNSGAEEFSQWVRFSKAGSTYSIAPRLTTPIIYTPLTLSGVTTLVSYAAPGATAWTAITDSNSPYYGSSALPCSTFAGGALAVGAEHCTGGDVYTDIYTTGSFWAFKVAIGDSAGRQSVAETLFRVESRPEPYIDDHEWTGTGTTALFTAFAPDTPVTSWTIECTNVDDSGDVVSGTGTAMPIAVSGFTPGEEYSCIAKATNGAGTGESYDGDYYVTAPDIALTLQFTVGDFYAGKIALIEGSGLDSYSEYSLVMFSDPLTLLEDETDETGSFSEEVTIPEEACLPGQHELRLTGLASGGQVTSSQYIEIDENCFVVAIRSTPFGDAELADTGAGDLVLGVAFTALLVGLGTALVVGRRRLVVARG